MNRNTFTLALVLTTLCFALLGNGCSENGNSIMGPEQIGASDIPAGNGQQAPFRTPSAPAALKASWTNGHVMLDWVCSCKATLFYRVYRRIDGGPATLLRATSYSDYTDDLRHTDYGKVVYWVTGVDAYGNESNTSNQIGSKKSSALPPKVQSESTDGM